MIPVRLKLQNFMSYRETEGGIDFTPIHLACVIGENGHGKSALLDAMTWALWGKARARRDDDLITRGESEMEVCFDFDLGDERYRVLRRRSSRGRGASELHLQVRHGANGHFNPLDGGTIRETQQRINELLRLDYDTFVNSAFLLQGRADEFTQKRPNERKQILADILGLAIYDTLAERAKQRMRTAEQQRDLLDRELEAIQREVDAIPDYERGVIDAEAAAHELSGRLRDAEGVLRELREQKRELDLKAEQLTEAERRAADVERQVLELNQRIAEREVRLRRYDALLGRTAEIEAGYTALLAARQEAERWNEITRQLMELQGEQGTLQREVDRARAALEGDLRVAERDAADLRQRAARAEALRGQLTSASADLRLLEGQQRDLEETRQRLATTREEMASRKQQNEYLHEQMKALRERLDMLAQTEAATCPVCRQGLSPAHREAVHSEITAEGTAMGERYRENKAAMGELQRSATLLEATIAELETKVRRLGRAQGEVARLTQQVQDAESAERDLAAATQRATTLRGQLERGEYALDVQGQLRAVQATAAALGYDRAAHEAARHAVQAHSAFEAEHGELQIARQSRDGEQAMIATLQAQRDGWQSRLREIEAEATALRQTLAGRAELVARTETQQRTVNELQRSAVEAERRLGGARQRLEFAEQQAQKAEGKMAEKKQWEDEREIFGQLQFAFGPRGLQALLIEQAVPELEEAANELLGRMTDGRMRVKIETQREGKTTDTPIETLDILLADEQGERPYELFSGGEAFRANFALRIALSKLLARRAGARLQTLVIDEGFGTQDAQGRERLVEAITTIQDEFEKILVITHVDELKDAFPARIDIVKGPNGSRVLTH